ncbi:MAG: helix-turn-helix transcriptional regulator [Syntrophobacterales bacterium]|nr:helix-turn-helix transcriptional regulator [Syntrophobacterales bacterium]
MLENKKMGTPVADELKIGSKVRELRQKKHYTLQDLVTKTGLSKSVLTEIEDGDTIPPVATLLKLSKALKVGMAYFFEDEVISEKISVTRSGERMRLERRPHHHEGEVDYSYETLETKKPDKHMEPLLVEFRPMDTSDMIFMSHEGEEFLYVLEETLEFRTDDRIEILNPGDTIYFESDINHSFRSLTDQPARAIVVVWAKG